MAKARASSRGRSRRGQQTTTVATSAAAASTPPQRPREAEVVGEEPAHRADEGDVHGAVHDQLRAHEVDSPLGVGDERVRADEEHGDERQDGEPDDEPDRSPPPPANEEVHEQRGRHELEGGADGQADAEDAVALARDGPERDGQAQHEEAVDLPDEQRVVGGCEHEQQQERDGVHPAAAEGARREPRGRHHRGDAPDLPGGAQRRLAERDERAQKRRRVGRVAVRPHEPVDMQRVAEGEPGGARHPVGIAAVCPSFSGDEVHPEVDRLPVDVGPDRPRGQSSRGRDRGDHARRERPARAARERRRSRLS